MMAKKKDKTPKSDTSQLLGSEEAGEVLRKDMEAKRQQAFLRLELKLEAVRTISDAVRAIQDIMRDVQ